MTGLASWLRVQWDRAGAMGAALVGLAALALGWVGVSGTPHIAEQLPYFISGGLVALFFLGLAVTLWLSADLRDEWRELRALRLSLAEPVAETNLTDAPLAQVAAANGTGR
jgi:peptidoglycan/LPS O-acetylase OafA/YrhL